MKKRKKRQEERKNEQKSEQQNGLDRLAGQYRTADGNFTVEALMQYAADVINTASKNPAYHPELEEIITILETLKDEKIRDADELKDYIFDYHFAAEQCKKAHEKYEKPEKVVRDGLLIFCPACHARAYHGNQYCGKCGKKITE